jgi:hypothetical protein
MKDFVISRLGERSTWAAILMCAGAWGLSLTEQQQAAITALGLALAIAPDKNHFKK